MRHLWLLCLLMCSAVVSALENRNVAGVDQAPVLREVEPFLTRITVRNPHDRAVKVKQLDPTCKCATLEIADRFILPKATTTLTIAVDNANRSGPVRVGVSIYLTDPDLETIEVEAWWQVRACIQVDAIGPTMDPLVRPADRAWNDIYRYITKVRPDEPNRLRKRVRVSAPAGEVPEGGLQILGIDYPGKLWRFTPTAQADGSWLITASAQGGDEATLTNGEYLEKVVVRTNHKDKPTFTLEFNTLVAKDAGQQVIDPGFLPPPPGFAPR
ncbi:MAG: DUF1573 domain-containing protein [Planctomycetes bacterium]|jgi:hypothetical protein|nr:DUF1573 domain-containing protein [Planctomycetota bacterium]